MLTVGARNGCGCPFSLDGHERANLATYIDPRMVPLPPPSRINLPSPSTRITPLNCAFPFRVRFPVTIITPAPPSSVALPLTNVKTGVVVVPDIPEQLV